MNVKILDILKLSSEREHFTTIKNSIEKDAEFQGTNLWILVFAILIASLGLNINATAVVIGAMLISPLMGPIVGVGVGLAINDLVLIKKAGLNYLFAMIAGLIASTLYFLISPIDDAHSEILSRTLPTVYDVMIALFGGFAGAIALSSKHKGNVIPGVAIATALMPPLCTAGYGLATWQLTYFMGAFYLYLINSVFIAAATIVTSGFLKFPIKKYEDPSVEKKERFIVLLVILLTTIPSLYIGFNIVEQNQYNKKANHFIESEAVFPNDYLLKKSVDPEYKIITLTFGGELILEDDIDILKAKLKYYGLDDTELIIKHGFTLPDIKPNEEKVDEIGIILQQKELERAKLQSKLDSMAQFEKRNQHIFNELKALHPVIISSVIQNGLMQSDSIINNRLVHIVWLQSSSDISKKDQANIKEWLKIRLQTDDVKLSIEMVPDGTTKKK
ncbi:MAG: TIGR00341 family protein [Saprospiraceae bacterium]